MGRKTSRCGTRVSQARRPLARGGFYVLCRVALAVYVNLSLCLLKDRLVRWLEMGRTFNVKFV